MAEPIPWEALRTVIEAQPPWAGAEATWAALLAQWDVSRVLFSRSGRDTAGSRLDAVALLPAVLVLPAAWRLRLPPLGAWWTIPSREAPRP